MSRFILYSGLAHTLAFVGIVSYMSTRPKESLPTFLTPTAAPVLSQLEAAASTATVAPPEANNVNKDPESNHDIRDRKVRASLTTPPDTPRVVEKVEEAHRHATPPKTLPAKIGAASLGPQESSMPETAKDINEITDSEITAGEPSEFAPFDVDQMADSTLQQIRDEEKKSREQDVKSETKETNPSTAAETEEEVQPVADNANAAVTNPTTSENPAANAAIQARPLSSIVQVPGNKNPEYDVEDRRLGRSGLVVFLAYINKEGKATAFEMVASSGHRSLDGKTLKAIKGWKFKSGQEGWVEIPFQWDLKGGAQEAPSSLRRQNVSR